MGESIYKSLLAASSVPRVPFFVQLVSGLVQCGCKIVPSEYWKPLGDFFTDDSIDNHDEAFPSWVMKRNHWRGESHESWQARLPDQFNINTNDPADLDSLWVIPIDDLVCLSLNDENASEFIEISRLCFHGTEAEMRLSLKEWEIRKQKCVHL